MNAASDRPLMAIPEGGAELRLVLQLGWGDVADLGRVASELASRFQRPVSLDEAASHRLRAEPKPVVPTGGQADPAQNPSAVFPARTSVEPARQAIAPAGRTTVAPASTEAGGAPTARHTSGLPAVSLTDAMAPDASRPGGSDPGRSRPSV